MQQVKDTVDAFAHRKLQQTKQYYEDMGIPFEIEDSNASSDEDA